MTKGLPGKVVYSLTTIILFLSCCCLSVLNAEQAANFPLAATAVAVSFEEPDLQCAGHLGHGKSMIINSQEEYQELIDGSPDLRSDPALPCADYKFPVIDFLDKTLISRSTESRGCGADYKKTVWRDDTMKQIVYHVEITQHGSCEKDLFSENWILLSKIPEDYRIIFKVDTFSESEKRYKSPNF